MDSLRVTGTFTLGGGATGVTGDPELTRPFSLRLLTALTSVGSAGTLGTKALYHADRPLAASGDESFDLTNFTSVLQEAGTSLSKVRLLVVYHSVDSLASSIRYGGAGTPFAGLDDTAGATKTLLPGQTFPLLSPTAAGMAVSAGQSIRVRNLDAANAATYTIGVFGE